MQDTLTKDIQKEIVSQTMVLHGMVLLLIRVKGDVDKNAFIEEVRDAAQELVEICDRNNPKEKEM